MKRALLILSLLTGHAQAQVQADPAPPIPAVWPAQTGSVGTSYKMGTVQYFGTWVKWSRTVGTVKTTYIVCARPGYTVIHPNTEGMTPIRVARAYWLANVDRDCSSDPQLQPLFEAALAAQ